MNKLKKNCVVINYAYNLPSLKSVRLTNIYYYFLYYIIWELVKHGNKLSYIQKVYYCV